MNFCTLLSDAEQESHEAKVILQEEDVDTLRRFLSYLYTQNYEEGAGELASSEHGEAETVGNADAETDAQGGSDAQTIVVAEVASVSEVAHNNLLVYIAADKFGTEALKQLAKDRLITWARNNWSDGCFPTVVSEIIARAPPHEQELCEILSDIICENAQNLIERGPMLDVLEEFGTLTTAVLTKLVGRLAQSDLERERLIALGTQSFGSGLMRTINSLTKCRHCYGEFNLRVESATIGWGSVRCGKCRTRH
ncbi:hypothetical protein DPV78_003398 [Talaromyces pinophilus]|nr:hypothetical protein DPV78_003398 [Talaromyces pinophilus]